MMKRKNQSPSASIGIASLLVVFLILCLVTFAVLSLSTAKNNYQFSEKTAKYKTEYYKASDKSQEILASIQSFITEAAVNTAEDDFDNALKNHLSGEHPKADIVISDDGAATIVSWSIFVNHKQSLQVSVKIPENSSGETGYYQVQKYKLVSTDSGDYNQNMKLLK